MSAVDSARRFMPSPKAGAVSNNVRSSWCRWRLGRSRNRPLLYIPAMGFKGVVRIVE